MSPRELLNRIRDWMRRDQLLAEADDELRFHREMLARDQRAAGASDADATRTAARRLGNLTRLRERLRDAWGIGWMDELAQDLRYTFRGFGRQPGFTVAVILTLGVGIGANAAMFGVIDRLMFRPYPWLRDPSSVHRVYLASVDRGRERISAGAYEYTRYLDLKRWTTSFSQVAAFSTRMLPVGVGESARERQVATVSASFFDFFDARPALGRFFLAAEDTTPRGADVAIVSYAFWQSEFGGRDVLGRSLAVGNFVATIVGVAPVGFVGVDDDRPPEVYIPITTFAGSQGGRSAATYYTRYNWGWASMMVRRKPGVSVEQATADLSAAYVRSWVAMSVLNPGVAPVASAKPRAWASAMRPGRGPDPSLDARTALWVSGVAMIVLLIACANVANLFLARAFRRRREIAVRLALGVSRRRLLSQCVTEGLVLSAIGGVVGLAIAQWGGAGIRALYMRDGGELPVLTDARTLVIAIALAIAVGVVTGLAPAIFAAGGDLAGALKAGAREGTYHRSVARSALLVTQGALSVVLLVGAGVFVRSLDHVRAVRLGYDADPVLLAVRNGRGTPLSDKEDLALAARLLETAKTMPGVENTAWVSTLPFYNTSQTSLFVEGIDSVSKLGRFTYQTSRGDYFTTMGTRIVRGRPLTADDREGSERVGVVSEAMAAALWPGKDAIGQCMRVGADTVPCTRIVGVAENAFQNDLTADKGYNYYLPMEQCVVGCLPTGGFALLVRMRGDAAAQAEPVRKALQSIMPGQMYMTVQPFAAIVNRQRRAWLFGATMFAAFGGLALLVAAVGLYSVIAYDVAQRTHELGVRVALGAQSRDVVRLVVGKGLRFALAGIGLGAVLAFVTGRWLQPLLFHESARDPVVFAVVAAALLLAAVAATVSPALRASRTHTNRALRAD